MSSRSNSDATERARKENDTRGESRHLLAPALREAERIARARAKENVRYYDVGTENGNHNVSGAEDDHQEREYNVHGKPDSAAAVGSAALRYFDLSHSRNKSYEMDPKRGGVKTICLSCLFFFISLFFFFFFQRGVPKTLTYRRSLLCLFLHFSNSLFSLLLIPKKKNK